MNRPSAAFKETCWKDVTMPQAITLAQDQSDPPPGEKGAGSSGLGSMLPLMLIMFAIIYFLLIRPQSKERKRHKAMLDDLLFGGP